MGRTLLRMLAAATAAAVLSASGFTITAAAQSDQQPISRQAETSIMKKSWEHSLLDAEYLGFAIWSLADCWFLAALSGEAWV